MSLYEVILILLTYIPYVYIKAPWFIYLIGGIFVPLDLHCVILPIPLPPSPLAATSLVSVTVNLFLFYIAFICLLIYWIKGWYPKYVKKSDNSKLKKKIVRGPE